MLHIGNNLLRGTLRCTFEKPRFLRNCDAGRPQYLAHSDSRRGHHADVRNEANPGDRRVNRERHSGVQAWAARDRQHGRDVPHATVAAGPPCTPKRWTEATQRITQAAHMRIPVVALTLVALLPARATAQTPDLSGALHWRTIGPFRAGRARALAGVPGQPTVFYIGFDNGGLWRSSDYGSNWEPLFDHEATGSIGAIAVAPSSPNIIYVGTGAGIIRPDLATGNGMYRSNDTGRTWTQLGLAETQMIAYVDVDPTNPDRLFVAALGHPYGPNAERGIYRSTDGGRTFEKVLYKDEYTSGNEVRIVPSNPNTVYAALWQQQSPFYEYAAFGPDSTSPGAGR